MAVLGDMNTFSKTARTTVLTALTLAFACSEGFVVGDQDTGNSDAAAQDATALDATAADAIGFDTPAQDTSVPSDPCEPPNPCSGACGLPWLLAAAQDAGGRVTPDRCGGHVFRYSLAETPACACPSYSLGIEELPQTASYIPGGTVLVGTQRRAYTFGASGTERSIEGQISFDSFIVEGQAPGSNPVGVLIAGRPGSATYRLFVFGPDGSFEALESNGAVRVQNKTATQNPANRRGYRAADTASPSLNRFFWEGGADGPAHISAGGSGDIEAFYANGFHRTTVVEDDGIRHVAQETLTLDNAPSRIACTEPEYDGCVYRGGAPDPTSEHHVYVSCSQPSGGEGSASRIARLDVRDGSCVDLLPLGHWPGTGITHLSVGLEDYWAP